MGANDVVQLISSVGFPIVACIYLATRMEKTMVKMTLALNELNSRLKSQGSRKDD